MNTHPYFEKYIINHDLNIQKNGYNFESLSQNFHLKTGSWHLGVRIDGTKIAVYDDLNDDIFDLPVSEFNDGMGNFFNVKKVDGDTYFLIENQSTLSWMVGATFNVFNDFLQILCDDLKLNIDDWVMVSHDHIDKICVIEDLKSGERLNARYENELIQYKGLSTKQVEGFIDFLNENTGIKQADIFDIRHKMLMDVKDVKSRQVGKIEVLV